ncbi:DEAD/DEAH box helicase [Limosilactobacillus fermentum]|uniref:SNF2-related protein n=1 Tax=Limosilactobacillus fermentum TaxID=1613 RepID=UPI00389131DA
MKYNPHEYQKYATNFIIDHPVAAILLDMGLGKSVITLTAINDLIYNSFEVNRVLVIAPLRVANNTWPDEIKKWDHLSHLTYSVVTGNKQQRLAALRQDVNLYIINRENLKWLVEDYGVPFFYDMIVIDELSSFKSYRSQRFKCLKKLRPHVKRIVGLTGTPSSNGLMDLWAEFRVLDMGQRLGRYITHYRTTYFDPDKRNQHMVFTYKPKPGAEQQIYQQISDITISMKSKDYLKLPPLTMNTVKVHLSNQEAAVYDTMRDQLVVDTAGKQIDALNAASLSNKLSQMANGTVYDDNRNQVLIHDRKLDALEDLIEAANGKPVLFAYWFKHDLERIKQRFEVREIKTTKDISDWNQGTIPVGVIHPASAGHGLNLQAGGSTLIWYGLTWSLELYQQTNARLWRQGQTDPVVIHHIITENTIDEDILAALKRKDKAQTALINAVKANLKGVVN